MGADLDFDRPYVVEELIRWGNGILIQQVLMDSGLMQ